MAQRKPTKQQKAARRRAKESAAKRHKSEPLRPIDIWAVTIVEAYEALIRNGMNKDQARWFIEEKMKLPEWIQPVPEFVDDEDDEQDEDY